MEKRNRVIVPAAFFLAVYLLMAFAMWCTPLSSDDCEFASLRFSGIGDFLNYVLYYGNGRVLGNVFSISLSQFPSAAVFVKSFFTASLVVLVPLALKKNDLSAYLASFLLLMGIRPSLFGEVYTWTSGFSNYIPPVWTMLVLVCFVQFQHSASWGKWMIMCIGTCIFGFAGQFFVEHSAVLNVIVALALLAITWVHAENKRDRVIPAIWFLTAAAGLFLMLKLPSWFYVPGNRSVGYRSVNLGGILDFVRSCARNAMQLTNHYQGPQGLVVCAGAFAAAFLTRYERSEKANNLLFLVNSVSTLYLLFGTALSVSAWHGYYTMIQNAVSVLFVIAPVLTWLIAAWKLPPEKHRYGILGLLVCAVMALGMFLIVSPTPARVSFLSYIFAVGAFLLTAEPVWQQLPVAVQKKGKILLRVGAVLLVLILLLVFFNCRNMAKTRENHILREMEAGAQTIEIYRIPYDYIFWDNPWGFSYQYYYEEPGDITFVPVEYYTWRDSYAEYVTY